MIMVLLLAISALHATQDLEEKAQDFVLTTKQIKLKEYKHAFNPSIIEFNGRLLLSFRVIPNKKDPFTSWLGLVWIDKEFNPISPIQKLDLRDAGSEVPPRMEDGRLITLNDELYITYSDCQDETISRGGFRMYIAKLAQEGDTFKVAYKERLSFFNGSSQLRREKNWAPFVYGDDILLSYSFSPHKVFAPTFGTNTCKTAAVTYNSLPWKWGEVRGGSPALKQDDHYLGFFHSCIQLQTVHNKKRCRHYFMGAYVLEQQPPFKVTHISNEPIIGKNFYNGPSYKPYWGSIQAVFPGGYIQDEHSIWLVYGRQDHEMWVAQLDRKKLYETFVPVEQLAKNSSKYIFGMIADFFEDLIEDIFHPLFGCDAS